MKIRKKITLIFILFNGALLLGVFSFVYYLSYRHTEKEFTKRLEERANIVAQSYLEKDELSAHIYDEIRKKHFQILPEEQEMVLRVSLSNQKIVDSLPSRELPDHFIETIFQKKTAHFKEEDINYTGILYTDNEGNFIVVVSARDQFGQTKMENLRNTLIIALCIGLAGIYLIGRYYAGKVLDPISKITEKANSISAANLNLRLDTGKNKDELSELAVTFNKMLDRLETSFEIQTNFVNNASHELKNPLTAILGITEIALLKASRSVDEYKESLGTIEKEAQRLSLLVNSLLSLAQSGAEGKGLFIESIRVDEMVMGVKQNMDEKNPENQIIFDFSELPVQSDMLIILGNESLLQIAVSNLLDNACKFSMNKEVVLKVTGSEGQITMLITDQGVGIPEADLRDISEPFYRASNARGFQGFGVGLSLSQKIIKLHKGILQISSKESAGTTVRVSFPVESSSQQPSFR